MPCRAPPRPRSTGTPPHGHGRHPVTQPTVKGITRVVDTLKLAKAYTFTMAAVTATSTGPAATFTAKTAAD